jgi:phosphatidylethanolamine-binding protein (PEBP) family uncharacterized protein
LDILLPNLKHPTKGTLEELMLRHILAEADLYGTYEKER